jgi:hypothetical protein
MSDLDTLWDKSDDELLAEAGRLVVGDSLGAAPPDIQSLIETGRVWIVERKKSLCTIICKDERVKQAVVGGALRKDFVALIIDVLVHNASHFSPLPPASVALLFCRLGYHQLCRDFHEQF